MLAPNSREDSFEENRDIGSESNLGSASQDQLGLDDLGENDQGKKIGKWTAEEDDLLRKFVPLFGEKQWRKISQNIPGRTSIQCLHRWTKILKPGLVKGPWTAEEDQKLISWVNKEGPTKWAQCSNFIQGRSGKQCRERWFNNLNPDVKKGNWTKEEDELIFDLYQKHGSSWSKIAKFIPGRTENAIKNRFYSTLRKLAADKKKGKEDTKDDVSIKEAEEDKMEIEVKEQEDASASGQNLTVLYKLLHDKTAVPEHEETKVENVASDTKPLMNEMKSKLSVKKNEQVINASGEKTRGKKSKRNTFEQNMQEANLKSMSGEMEESDLEFEEFLISLNGTVNDDFLSREFEPHKGLDDVSHLEDMQARILNYCQSNIKDLADAFKTVVKPKAGGQEEVKNKTSLMPGISSFGSNIPKVDTIQQPVSNIRGTTILTPTPSKTKGFSLKNQQLGGKLGGLSTSPNKGPSGPSANAFSLYSSLVGNPFGISNKLSPNRDSEGSSDKHTKGKMLQENNSEFVMPNEMNREKISLEFPNAQYNFNDLAQKLSSNDMQDTEKRMTFLFQQLFSLETLLTKTRNDLVQLESSLNQNDRKNSNQENLKIEELENVSTTDRSKQTLKQRSLERLNSEFEQILKKKKVE